MKKLLVIILIPLSGTNLSAQTNLDSLYTLWQDPVQPDSTRTNAYKDYIWQGFLFAKPDTAITLAQALLRFGETQPYPKASARAYHTMGVANALKSNYPRSAGLLSAQFED